MSRPSDVSTLLTENIQPRRGRRGWHGGPTPVGAVRGVSAEQALWRPARGRKNIWELALHIAYWKYAVRRRLDPETGERGFARKPSNWPNAPTHEDDTQWRADVALLQKEHDALVETIRGISPKRYSDRAASGRQWTVGELIVGIAQHDAYHTGQIQLIKRLWSATSD